MEYFDKYLDKDLVDAEYRQGMKYPGTEATCDYCNDFLDKCNCEYGRFVDSLIRI